MWVDFIWPRVLRFVTAWYDGQATVARVDIRQHEHHDCQIIVDSTLMVLVMVFALIAFLAAM